MSERADDPKVIRTTGDYDDPSIQVDDLPMLAANPMSDREMAVFVPPQEPPSVAIPSNKPEPFVRATQPHGSHGSPLDDERWEESETAPPSTVHSAAQRVLAVQPYTVHGEHSTAMTSGGEAEVAFESEQARALDSTGGYATNQGGTIVGQRTDDAPMDDVDCLTPYPEMGEAIRTYTARGPAPPVKPHATLVMTGEEEEECESRPCSAGSEDSTSDSSGPATRSSSNARPTSTAGPSLDDIGQTPPDMTMSARSDSSRSEAGSISSAEDSPARISASPDDDEDSRGSAADFSSSSHESPTLFSATEDGSSLRTYPDFFPRTTDEISPSFSRRWPSSGFTTSPTECWTADTSESPSVGGAFSSLRDVLEATAPKRFSLSPKAAAGILRRAARRGKALPATLERALLRLAGPATETSPEASAPSGEREAEDPPATSARTSSPTDEDQMTLM